MINEKTVVLCSETDCVGGGGGVEINPFEYTGPTCILHQILMAHTVI